MAKKNNVTVSLDDMIDVVDDACPKWYQELCERDISDKRFEKEITRMYNLLTSHKDIEVVD